MRVPIFALIAPIVTSVILWLVTGSAYTLLFALLGPIMALAQFADGKLQVRKSEKLKQEHDDEEEITQRARKHEQRQAERDELILKYPAASQWALPTNNLRPAWAASAQPEGTQRLIRIGLAFREGKPLVIDAQLGIAVCGDDVEARSALRAMYFQLLWTWGISEATKVGWSVGDEPELDQFTSSNQQPADVILHRVNTTEVLPSGVRYLLSINRGRAVLRDVVDPVVRDEELQVDLLTRAESNRIITLLRAESEAAQARHAPVITIPSSVPSVINTSKQWEQSRDSLLACVGRKHDFPLFLDLVHAGPHAVIAGMTGSGKTEFLLSWMLTLASMYSPQRLSLLLIDYKGGAGFSRVKDLPHVTSVLTDLSPQQTRRAISSLQAEIRHREHVLAEAGVADISDLPVEVELSRLLIVVDEYRVLTESFAECAALFVDVASRGRSLGMHLILSSQRTGGVINDAILANCSLRVCFRVSEKADSHGLLGVEDAYQLPHIPGRAFIQGTGLSLTEFQAAKTSDEDLHAVLRMSRCWLDENSLWEQHVPWKPELPRVIASSEMPAPLENSAWLGILDIPEHQAQDWTPYIPHHDGNLLISGLARSGVSCAVASLHYQLGGLLLRDSEIAWDAVVEESESLLREGTKVFIEDLDHLLDCFGLEHREQFLASLTRCVRLAPQRNAVFVIGTKDHPRGTHALVDLFPVRLQLLGASEPGRGLWRGHQIQLFHVSDLQPESGQWGEMICEENRSYAVITHRKTSLISHLTNAYGDRVSALKSALAVSSSARSPILIGTPDEWMLNHAQLTEICEAGLLILDGCSPSEIRGLRLKSGLFPHTENDTALVVEADGSTTRAVLRT
ncbi:FtsK/SpoIIIE domain-containing protein [Aurantimicrobium sp. MWH-Uga1]|uniref:FtsK/SpoIIIE domain-containing protein n=1 Tax=Aurantimicrobium sp. MWH-Uga1 TaxID=2079575 RepID=UPI000DED902C|nr:FtsK/SpoIIIE domain-containing protein [Aurantimicrobium sp. MWH-Uga1]AXE54838.1 ESX-1 secretion system protein EccCa1 [Aurantimicrobium sp. MWH-Uga1]